MSSAQLKILLFSLVFLGIGLFGYLRSFSSISLLDPNTFPFFGHKTFIAFKEPLPTPPRRFHTRNAVVDETRTEGGAAVPRRLGTNETKRILFWSHLYTGFHKWPKQHLKCGNLQCELTTNKELLNRSHALIFHGWVDDMPVEEVLNNGTTTYKPEEIPDQRFQDQYWIFFGTEPPVYFPPHLEAYDSLFNWTMTYRRDSDVVFSYGKFKKRAKPITAPSRDTLFPKTRRKLVAQIDSGCDAAPSKRQDLVKALQEHIPVDVYGNCGPFNCPNTTHRGYDCKLLLAQHYKFFLSFENSVCKDYVTEKLYHAYTAGMVPVVYGGVKYTEFSPSGSFINVRSFPTARALAQYLLYLDRNDAEYSKYFEWRRHYEVEAYDQIYNRGSYCSLCRKLHRDYDRGTRSVYPSLTRWLHSTSRKGVNKSTCRGPFTWPRRTIISPSPRSQVIISNGTTNGQINNIIK